MSLVPGVSLIPIALLLWFLYGPVGTDLRMALMLISSALGGILIYQALGLWSSLLGPRSLPTKATFGKRLSLAGNVVMMAGIYWMMFIPHVTVRFGASLMRHWWMMPLYATAGCAFFAATVAAGGPLLVRRRERMLSQIDRRQRVAAA